MTMSNKILDKYTIDIIYKDSVYICSNIELLPIPQDILNSQYKYNKDEFSDLILQITYIYNYFKNYSISETAHRVISKDNILMCRSSMPLTVFINNNIKKFMNKNMVYISTIDTPVTIDIVVYNMLYSRINNGEI